MRMGTVVSVVGWVRGHEGALPRRAGGRGSRWDSGASAPGALGTDPRVDARTPFGQYDRRVAGRDSRACGGGPVGPGDAEHMGDESYSEQEVTDRRREIRAGGVHARRKSLPMTKSNTVPNFGSTEIPPEVEHPAVIEPEVEAAHVGVFDGVACRGARTMLGLTQTELCAKAGVGRNTLNDFEMLTRQPRASNVEKIRRALEALGADFPDLGDGTVVVRVRQDARPGPNARDA